MATPTPRSPAPTPPAGAGLRFTGDINTLVQQVTSLSGGLPPVAAATVTSDEVALRRGPALSDDMVGAVRQGELAALLGKNAAGDWWYVLTESTLQGWLPADAIQITFSLGAAPTLPPDIMEQKPPQATSSGSAAANPLGGLEPVAAALVTLEGATMRQGPATTYPAVGTLEQGELAAVLGTNAARDWVFVITLSVLQGWLPADALRVTGSLAEAPVLSADPVAANATQTSSPASSVPPNSAARAAGQLVFQLSSGGDIMVINADGTGLRRLTQGIDPVLSPDGQTVAFTRWTGEDGTLWLIGVDGGHERAVLGETKQAKHPSWSPDGQRLVVNFQHGGRLDPKQICENLIKLGNKNPGIPFNVDPDTVEVKLKDNQPYLCWTLPPDPHWGLRVVQVADSSYEDMPSDSYAFGPEWDPVTPWRIISSGLSGLVQLDVNRAAQWALTNQGEDHTPAFSPDGRYIAVAFNNNGQYDIHRLNSDGNGRVALTQTPLWVTAEAGEQKPWNNVAPAWSPDGSQIAFLSDRTGRWEIWVMNADGSHQRPMFADQVNDQLDIHYDFVDERVLSWR
jgi:uncharacterized protein YgiM (DUF1202 family)